MNAETIQAGNRFNQELITKARKGEIAILNDGTKEEIKQILEAVWPEDKTPAYYGEFYFKPEYDKNWVSRKETNLPAHSVKDFFMPDTKDTQQPRTYKVTRQQMKEIWEAAHNKNPIQKLAEEYFAVFADDILFDDAVLFVIRQCFNQEKPEVLVKHFPSYFFIPEGEPVLCREEDGDAWTIAISDGKGGVFAGGTSMGSSIGWNQIIPFTKNPPK